MNKYHQPVEAEIDLHQMTKEEAREEVFDFLQEAKACGYKKIRIITGKGIHSKEGIGILRDYIKEMLDDMEINYTAAKYNEGGEGAIDIVLDR